MCLAIPPDHSLQQFQKKWIICVDYPGFSSGIRLCGLLQLQLILSCGWIRVAAVSSPGGWMQVTTESRSDGWIQVTADSNLRLTRVPAAGYGLRPTPSNGWLEFWRLDTSYSWLHSTADSSSGGWIRLKVDSILRLTRAPAARYELQLILSCGWLEFYTSVYQVNLKTYSAKYIIFMVCFLPTNFSYHWSRPRLLLQEEAWGSLKKLEEAWRSFKTLAATDSNCSHWFELWRLIRDLRPIDYLQNFDPDAPW